jgi:hypothetical protein
MTSSECRARAVECYRLAQKTADPETRHTLLGLAIQWRELATQIDRANSGRLPSPGIGNLRQVTHRTS